VYKKCTATAQTIRANPGEGLVDIIRKNYGSTNLNSQRSTGDKHYDPKFYLKNRNPIVSGLPDLFPLILIRDKVIRTL